MSRSISTIDRLATVSRIRIAAVAVSSIGFVIAVIAAAATNAYTSDDVFVQNILDSLKTGSGFAPVVGGDNFALKVPLYLLLGAILPNGPVALTITVLAVDTPLVVALIVLSDRAAAPRGRLALVTAHVLVAWFLVSRIAPMSSLMIPNGRNGEIGIALLVLAWWCSGIRSRRDVVARVIVMVLLAVLFFSDGFFIYALLPACGLVAVVAWLARLPYARRAGLVTLGVGVAALLALGLTRIAKLAGVEVLQNYVNVIPDAGSLPTYLFTSAGALARDLNGDAAGRALGLDAVPALFQVLLLLVLVALATRVVISGRPLRDLRVALALAAIVVNIALYVATSNASDPYSFRYVLLATMILLPIAAIGAGDMRRQGLYRTRLVKALAVLAVLAVGLGLATNARTVARAIVGSLPDPQLRTHRVIDIAEAHGASVGLGDYWDANITTYLSDGHVRVVPQDCTSGAMVSRAWLINRPDLDLADRATFVVIRSQNGCTPAVVRKSFGTPTTRVPLPDPGDAVWIYEGGLK